MTDAIGTQKTSEPSSVIQALFATSPKFSIPGRSLSEARWPAVNSSSDASNGRHVIRSPALPPSSLLLRAALYSVGAVGENVTLMLGFSASKAGMMVSSQTARSSLRQLSMVNSTVSPPAPADAPPDGAGDVVPLAQAARNMVMAVNATAALSFMAAPP